MRTKTLLLTAALSAAGVATSMAQVYSVNSVGYVNLSLANGFTIIANPLNGTNNNLNTILPLADAADGTTVYRFRNGAFIDPITFFAGFGWFSAGPAGDLVIDPGEGFFIQNTTGAPLPVTFVGEVPQGNLQNPIPGSGSFSIKSSQVPQAGSLTALGLPAGEGDVVFVFNPATQAYKDSYTYFDGFGWFSANVDDPGPDGPSIAVANGVWLQRNSGPNTSWNRTFSVN